MFYKLLLLTIFVVKFPVNDVDRKNRWIYLYHSDKESIIRSSAENDHCLSMIQNEINFISNTNLVYDIIELFDRNRFIVRGQHETLQTKVILKYCVGRKYDNFNGGVNICPKNIGDKTAFHSNDELEKLVFDRKYTSIKPIQDRIEASNILQLLSKYDFPVPKLFGVCKQIIIESYAGQPLQKYYQHHFQIRSKIALNLLKQTIKLSTEIDGFRFFLTDINPDNIVVDAVNLKTTFVDLDDIIVVDTKANTHVITKHEIIECYGCVAFSMDDLCNMKSSDFNIFQICQILWGDLYGNTHNGFLHSIPEEFRENLMNLLADCYLCEQNCMNRFEIVKVLINFLEMM